VEMDKLGSWSRKTWQSTYDVVLKITSTYCKLAIYASAIKKVIIRIQAWRPELRSG